MATIPRLFVPFDLFQDDRSELDADQGNYLVRVLRLGPGAPIRVFNGRDGEWRATIVEAGRKSIEIALNEQMRPQPVPHPRQIDVWIAPIKRARMDFIVEKATELGVRSVQPVVTARTQSDRGFRLERLQKIALEAAEQTERLDLPGIAEPVKLAAALEARQPGLKIIYCDEAGDDQGRARSIGDVLATADSAETALLVGPEGGFTPEERQQLRALDFVIPVTLGPRTLRAETAVVSALAVWQSMVGDWR